MLIGHVMSMCSLPVHNMSKVFKSLCRNLYLYIYTIPYNYRMMQSPEVYAIFLFRCSDMFSRFRQNFFSVYEQFCRVTSPMLVTLIFLIHLLSDQSHSHATKTHKHESRGEICRLASSVATVYKSCLKKEI